MTRRNPRERAALAGARIVGYRRSILLIVYTRGARPMLFARHALWTKYADNTGPPGRYGYEFADKAIAENYNKSAGNARRRGR